MKTRWWKIVLSVVACTLVDVILHRLFAPRIEYNFPPSGFLWTLGIGCSIAITYFLLKERDRKSSAVRAFRFGFLIFGSYWLIYNLFVLVFVRVSVLDIFARVIIDVLSVTVGAWVANRLPYIKTTVTG